MICSFPFALGTKAACLSLVGKANAKIININENTTPANTVKISFNLKSFKNFPTSHYVSCRPKILYVYDLYLRNRFAKLKHDKE
jgi:hypothetical protein